MRLMTATALDQGRLAGDRTGCVEGELVLLPTLCEAGRAAGLGCGCVTAFLGLASDRTTTTAVVRDLPLTFADLWVALGAHVPGDALHRVDCGPGTLEEVIGELMEIGDAWPAGTIVRRDADRLIAGPLVEA